MADVTKRIPWLFLTTLKIISNCLTFADHAERDMFPPEFSDLKEPRGAVP